MRDVPLRYRATFNAIFAAQHWLPTSTGLLRRKEAMRARIVEHVRRGGKGATLPVDRRENLSPREFRAQYLRRGLPVVLAGAGRDWRCTRDWSFDSFRRRFGAETIKLVQRKGVAPDDEIIDAREFSEETSFGEFLDQVLHNGRKYMRFSPLLEQFPELLN
ncbi:MAG: cupin-like domain-containing protein, partial [Terriglobia bacterium]